MQRIKRLDDWFDQEEYERLLEEFQDVVSACGDEEWAIMDSDEAPLIFYAEAWLDGYRYAEKQRRGKKK